MQLHRNISFQDERTLLTNLPEVRRLHGLVECSDWHNDDPLEQSLRLFHWMKRLPASLLETLDAPEAVLRTLLSSVVDPANGEHTVQALLAFSALIHDVGKAETWRRLPDGTTRCPGHEAVSARMASDICARFDLPPAEARFIVHLVGAHGEPYALFKRIAPLPAAQQQEQMRFFESEQADYFLPLLLLAFGDLVTSQLQTIREHKYEAVLEFYRLWMRTLWSREKGGTQVDRKRDRWEQER